MPHRAATVRWEPSQNPTYARDPFPDVPELFFLGFSKFHSAQKLPQHTHPGMMEITYLSKGVLTWCVEKEQQSEFHGGQVYCTWPDETHGGVDGVWEPCEMYWLLLTLPKKIPERYLGLPRDEAQALHRCLWQLPRRQFAAPPSLAEHFRQLFDAREKQGLLAQLAGRAALAGLLIDVCHAPSNSNDSQVLSRSIAEAVAIMSNAIETPWTIPAIAERIGLSVSHFSRRFKSETGSAPGDYYVRLRVNAARRLISETDLPLSKVARHCGFGTSQYLATCFRRVTGRPPSSFRRNASTERHTRSAAQPDH